MMAHPRRATVCRAIGLALGLLVMGLSNAESWEQEPGDPNAAPPPIDQPEVRRPAYPDHVRPQAYSPHQRRSIVHHYPYPYPGYYHGDATAGFRNPGGVGRHAEYYPPGDQFQVQNDPVRVAQFGKGGYPSRAEQMRAQSLGIQRYNSIQRHIDNYAVPRWGFGFGVGGFGGFW